MAKVLIFSVLCGLVVAFVKARPEAVSDGSSSLPTTTISPEDEALKFNDVVLGIITRRLATANLPPETQSAGQQILLDAEEGLNLCKENFQNNHIIWQYKICATTQLRKALDAIDAIEALEVAKQEPVISGV